MIKKDKTWIFIAILAFLLAMIYGAIGVINTSRTSTISEDVNILMQPLNPSVDTNLLDILKKRK